VFYAAIGLIDNRRRQGAIKHHRQAAVSDAYAIVCFSASLLGVQLQTLLQESFMVTIKSSVQTHPPPGPDLRNFKLRNLKKIKIIVIIIIIIIILKTLQE